MLIDCELAPSAKKEELRLLLLCVPAETRRLVVSRFVHYSTNAIQTFSRPEQDWPPQFYGTAMPRRLAECDCGLRRASLQGT
jgi:hypothetical protein